MYRQLETYTYINSGFGETKRYYVSTDGQLHLIICKLEREAQLLVEEKYYSILLIIIKKIK